MIFLKPLIFCQIYILDCPYGFKKALKTYTEVIRERAAEVYRNYNHNECAEFCRQSSGCKSFLYRQDMKWEHQKDEENGCFLYHESSDVTDAQYKRIGPKVQSYNEIACENLNYQSMFRIYFCEV